MKLISSLAIDSLQETLSAFLDAEYDYPLMYHGQLSGDSWPNRGAIVIAQTADYHVYRFVSWCPGPPVEDAQLSKKRADVTKARRWCNPRRARD